MRSKVTNSDEDVVITQYWQEATNALNVGLRGALLEPQTMARGKTSESIYYCPEIQII